MVAERVGDVTGGWVVAHDDEDGDTGDGSHRADDGDGAGAEAHGAILEDHGRSDKQRELWGDRHGEVLLRGGEGKEHHHEADPAEGEEADFAGAIEGAIGELKRRGEVDAPREKPDEVEGPEPEARDGVVVARVAQVEEAQQLLVEEEEPPEAVILAGDALHGEAEVRRIAQRGEDMPGCGDEQENEDAAEGAQPLPRARGEELAGEEEIEERRAGGKDDADQALEQESESEAGGHA